MTIDAEATGAVHRPVAIGDVGFATSGEDLWVVTRMGMLGPQLEGFVERTLGGFVAVRNDGTPLGTHVLLHDAKAAFRA